MQQQFKTILENFIENEYKSEYKYNSLVKKGLKLTSKYHRSTNEAPTKY